MVIWIIGLSGSGKSTLSKRLIDTLNYSHNNGWVHIDGDSCREIWGDDLTYDENSRKENSIRILKLCKVMEQQGLNVICSIQSVFPSHRNQARKIFNDFRVIHIDIDIDDLILRDSKGLYINNDSNIVGTTTPIPNFDDADVKVNGSSTVEESCNKILMNLGLDQFQYPYVNQTYDKRDKYQYSKYIGNKFINSFENQRQDFFSEYLTITQDISLRDILPSTTENDGSIQSILKRILEEYTDEHLLTLIKRYEVSKKIYIEYSYPKLSKITNEQASFETYISFSSILANKINNEPTNINKLIFLNCLLKVNDLIISLWNNYSLKSEYISLFSSSVSIELEAVKSLTQRSVNE